MSCLVVTTEQLETEFSIVFDDGKSMPSKCWIEHFHDDATYLRAVYADSLPLRGVDRMDRLRRRLIRKYGDPKTHLVVVLLMADADWEWFAAHRLLIHAR